MEAVILAAGIGKRIKPLSYVVPKPLLRLGDRTVIEHIIDWLFSNEISSIKIVLSSFGKHIENYLAGKYKSIQFVYSDPLGTAGQLNAIRDLINGTFVICYSDIVVNFDLKEMIKYHKEKNSSFTIATYTMSFPLRYGVISFNKEGKVLRWDEKPSISLKINAGVYVAEPVIFDFIEKDKILQMNDLVIKLIKAKLAVYSFSFEGEYFEIGTLEDYERVNKIFEERLGNI